MVTVVALRVWRLETPETTRDDVTFKEITFPLVMFPLAELIVIMFALNRFAKVETVRVDMFAPV